VYDAIVLAGGRGTRLGGVDKGAVDSGGLSLLHRVLTATSNAGQPIVVGPHRDLPYGVLGTLEDPPGGGPVAALAAGLDLVQASLVAVLACDLPFLHKETVDRLVQALAAAEASHYDGAHLVDDEGRPQPLIAAYRTASLRAALDLPAELPGTPMRDLLAGLKMLHVETNPDQAWDCDTWADVSRARERAAADHGEEA
jgi:molybdopterin-guanine dinucleotide biosynthesis protein A